MSGTVVGADNRPSAFRNAIASLSLESARARLDAPLNHARSKIRSILETFDRCFVERESQVRAALLAVLAGQHVLLLGPPGTAKSMIARALSKCFRDATYFEYLLSKFTHPDEIFGPVSIPGLKEEDYRRLTAGYLPQAHVAFLDEVFKANSAILNSLLTLVNERVFHHGRHLDNCPLLGLIGASNEQPDAAANLEALHDRFLVRVSVPAISDGGKFLKAILGQLPAFHLDPERQLSLDDIRRLAEAAATVTADKAVEGFLLRLRKSLRDAHVVVSDRRWRWSIDLLRMSAATSGREHISLIDAPILEACFGDSAAEQAVVRRCVRESLVDGRPDGEELQALQRAWKVVTSVGRDKWFKSWTKASLEAVDVFTRECVATRARLDQERARLQAEHDATPWATELPLELTNTVTGLWTRIEMYESCAADYRERLRNYRPAKQVMDFLEQRNEQWDYWGHRRPRVVIVRGPDNPARCIGLTDQGLAAAGGSDDALPSLVLSDALAHRVVDGSEANDLLKVLVGALVRPAGLTDAMWSLREAQARAALERFVTVARTNARSVVPVAPALPEPEEVARATRRR